MTAGVLQGLQAVRAKASLSAFFFNSKLRKSGIRLTFFFA